MEEKKTRSRNVYKNEVKQLSYMFPVWQGIFYRQAVKQCGADYRLGVVHLNLLTAGMSLFTSDYRRGKSFSIDDLRELFPFGRINYSSYMSDLVKADLIRRITTGKYLIITDGIEFIKRFNKVLVNLQTENMKTLGIIRPFKYLWD